MILIDANLLIYAHLKPLPQHPKAMAWLKEQFMINPRVGLPWQSILAFLRISSNPRVVQNAVPIDELWDQVLDWLSLDNVWIPEPGPKHTKIFGNLLITTNSSANLVSDAHLAALAIEHGLALYSADGDFARFKELRWQNPLL